MIDGVGDSLTPLSRRLSIGISTLEWLQFGEARIMSRNVMTKRSESSCSARMIAPLLVLAMLWSCEGQRSIPSGTDIGESAHEAVESNEFYTLPGLDHGLIQAPVNILTSKTGSASHEVRFRPGGAGAKQVVNTGHSVQVDFGAGSTFLYDGREFAFQQCHFHTPSEHQVDGITYPMEMHCVNVRPAPQGSEAPPEYLVLGFLFKMGQESRFIADFLDQVPNQVASIALTEGNEVYLEDLIVEFGGTHRYYSYRGSLTTPPFTETVNWLVLERIFEASAQQIHTINQLEGNNARHVQALYGRQVEVSTEP